LRAFSEDPKRYIDALAGLAGPLVITSRNRPVAVVVTAQGYEYNAKRLEGYERLVMNLESPEKARMEAHARAMAEISRRGRKV